jgi:hypothetical protein
MNRMAPLTEKKYVPLLKILDHLGCQMKAKMAMPAMGPDDAETSAAPAKKRRRVSTKGSRRTFYAAPSKMNTCGPASTKTPKKIPYIGMVRKSWRCHNCAKTGSGGIALDAWKIIFLKKIQEIF